MKLSDDLLRELLATFAVEAQEHLQAINRDLLALEKGPGAEKSAELLAEIFRAAHSLKGAARAVNLEAAGEVGHRLETLFARLRDGELAPSPALFDLAYQTLDALGVLVQPHSPADAPAVDVPALCARLEAAGAAEAGAAAALGAGRSPASCSGSNASRFGAFTGPDALASGASGAMGARTDFCRRLARPPLGAAAGFAAASAAPAASSRAHSAATSTAGASADECGCTSTPKASRV